jgi:hypothetical protein
MRKMYLRAQKILGQKEKNLLKFLTLSSDNCGRYQADTVIGNPERDGVLSRKIGKEKKGEINKGMKKLLKKWPFLAMAVILLATLVFIPTSAALASDPPPPVPPAIPTQLKCYGGSLGGTWGTYLDIYLNNTIPTPIGPLAGWCADEYNTIYTDTWYTDYVCDYFGYYYPSHLSDLPPAVTGINWKAIAWILNNKGTNSMKVIQEAFWIIIYPPNDSSYHGLSVWFSDSNPVDQAAAQALADDAVNNHSNFEPTIGHDIRPVICYSVDTNSNPVQILFFEFGGGTPPPPLPELPTVVLLGIGIVGLSGLVLIKRRTVKLTTA